MVFSLKHVQFQSTSLFARVCGCVSLYVFYRWQSTLSDLSLAGEQLRVLSLITSVTTRLPDTYLGQFSFLFQKVVRAEVVQVARKS